MKEKYKLKAAVILILTKIEDGREYVLLQKRMNTGIYDGHYDISCCGHLEKNENFGSSYEKRSKRRNWN